MENAKKYSAKKIILIVAVILTALVLLCIWFESLGIFPGSLFNKWAMDQYMHSHYPEVVYKTEKSAYDKNASVYVFTCGTGDGTNFTMRTKGLKIKKDGYFETYLQNTELQLCIEDRISQKLQKDADGFIRVLDVACDIKLNKNQYTQVSEQEADQVLRERGNEMNVVISVSGESLSYDEYKEAAYRITSLLKEYSDSPIRSLQLFYYRQAEGEDSENVMQYESYIASYMFLYDKDAFFDENGHRIVELTEKQQKNLELYAIFRIIYQIFLGVAVTALFTLWIVRRSRKKKRWKRGSDSSGKRCGED